MDVIERCAVSVVAQRLEVSPDSPIVHPGHPRGYPGEPYLGDENADSASGVIGALTIENNKFNGLASAALVMTRAALLRTGDHVQALSLSNHWLGFCLGMGIRAACLYRLRAMIALELYLQHEHEMSADDVGDYMTSLLEDCEGALEGRDSTADVILPLFIKACALTVTFLRIHAPAVMDILLEDPGASTTPVHRQAEVARVASHAEAAIEANQRCLRLMHADDPLVGTAQEHLIRVHLAMMGILSKLDRAHPAVQCHFDAVVEHQARAAQAQKDQLSFFPPWSK